MITVGLSNVIGLSLFGEKMYSVIIAKILFVKGVACASISSGFGEITVLQMSSFYPKYTVSAWSSGTGAAGLLGSLSYALMTGPLGIKPKTAILILLFIPVLQAIR